jgi:hypothetical protein
VLELANYDGAGGAVVAKLEVTFLEIAKGQSPRQVAIPFVGKSGGDDVTFEGMLAPPSPPYTIPPNYALSCHPEDDFNYVYEASGRAAHSERPTPCDPRQRVML